TQYATRPPLPSSRIEHRRHPFLPTLSFDECETSRPDTPLRLSSAQRLGLHRARTESAERREFDVGRLPCARTGAAVVARSARRELFSVCRLLRSLKVWNYRLCADVRSDNYLPCTR